MKTLKQTTYSLIIVFAVICLAGLALNLASLFAGWKPVVVPDHAFGLSISTQKPANTIQPGDYILITSAASGTTQHIEVTTAVPNGETTYQVETTLNEAGDITTFTTGTTVWVEQVSIPILGLVFMPFTSLPAAIVTVLTTLILLTWYRWQFYGKNPKPVEVKVDNIGMLQNIFDNAPTLTKKEAKRLSK